MIPTPPHHELEQALAPERDGVALWRARLGGRAVVTRLFVGARCTLELRAAVEAIGRGQRVDTLGLPDTLVANLVGFGVRARLGDLPALPEVLAVGVALDGPSPLGVPYLSAAWVEGSTLSTLAPQLGPEERAQALLGVLQVLVDLHARKVVFGDLKPSNVVLCGAAVRLIDLETLREVLDPAAPVPALAVTPGYSAPELAQRRLLYLASDVYAFGAMVAELLPQPEGRWAGLADACRRPEPGERPSAAALLAWLTRGEPLPAWTGTVRVPDQVAPAVPLEPVAPPGPPEPVLRVPDAPRPTTSRPRRGLWVALALAALLLVGVGAGGAWVMQRVAQANAAAEQVLARLGERQTELSANRTVSLDALHTEAEAAVALWSGPRPLTVRALTRVLSSRWHYTGTRWDAEAWARDLAALTEAEQAGDGPELSFARLFLFGGACWRMPDAEASAREARCAEAEAAYAALQRQLRPADPAWLRVDAAWAAVMTESRRSTRLSEGDPQRGALQDQALRLCGQVLDPKLGATLLADLRAVRRGAATAWPVNTTELAEECLVLAGARARFDDYLRFADLYLEVVEAQDAAGLARARDKVVRFVSSACIEGKVSLPRLQSGVFPLPERNSTPAAQQRNLCRMVGAAAIGCAAQTEWLGCETIYTSWWSGESVCAAEAAAEGLPWAAARSARDNPVRTECPL